MQENKASLGSIRPQLKKYIGGLMSEEKHVGERFRTSEGTWSPWRASAAEMPENRERGRQLFDKKREADLTGQEA